MAMNYKRDGGGERRGMWEGNKKKGGGGGDKNSQVGNFLQGCQTKYKYIQYNFKVIDR